MYTVVIPFLVVTSSFSAVNETDHATRTVGWTGYEPPYGLEYTFSVAVNFSKSLERNFKPYYELNLTSSLKCRPKNETVLSCILADRKTEVRYSWRFDIIHTGKEYFEINYNRNGVESLRVSDPFTSETGNNKYDLIKNIVSQLNVGTYFGCQRPLGFVAKESSTFGECKTRFTVSNLDCAKTVEGARKDLRIRTIFHDTLGDGILLRKERSAKRCDRSSHISFIESSDSLKPTATSSYSEMRFCEDLFESSTISEGKTVTLDKVARASIFRQIVNVRLESIDQTEEDFGTFPDDTATEIIYLHKKIEENDLDTQ